MDKKAHTTTDEAVAAWLREVSEEQVNTLVSDFQRFVAMYHEKASPTRLRNWLVSRLKCSPRIADALLARARVGAQ